MERIVQLKESEYEQLAELAKKNGAAIRQEAEEYYKDRGVYRIDLRIGLQERYNGDTTYCTSIFSSENGLYRKDEFSPIITEAGRRKIEKLLKNANEQAFYNQFGDVVELKNRLNHILQSISSFKGIMLCIAASGWVTATILLICAIL